MIIEIEQQQSKMWSLLTSYYQLYGFSKALIMNLSLASQKFIAISFYANSVTRKVMVKRRERCRWLMLEGSTMTTCRNKLWINFMTMYLYFLNFSCPRLCASAIFIFHRLHIRYSIYVRNIQIFLFCN